MGSPDGFLTVHWDIEPIRFGPRAVPARSGCAKTRPWVIFQRCWRGPHAATGYRLYLFSATTENSPGARDLSRRNAGKADPSLEISRLLRRPIFLRTKVRAPFARPANTLNTYGRQHSGR